MADRIVKVILRGDVAGLQASMATASRSVQDAANKMTGASKEAVKFRAGLTQVGDTAGKIGLVAAAGLGATVKAAMDWESAWAGVEKTVDGSASQMAVLEGELRELARTLPASHQEIAAVAEAAGQLGVKREAVAGFTETMINLGETTNLTAEEAATSMARFANVMGTPQTEVDRLGSALVELGNNSATTEAEILQMGQRLAAAGSIAGLSEGDVLGFAAALTSVGVEAEAGGTAMSKVFTAMRDAAIDGGDKLEVFARTAGMTAEEFTRAWSADPAKTVEAFVSGLGAINASGQSTSAVFKSLGLTDQRLSRALLSAAEAGDLLGQSLDLGNTGFEENTALAIEAAKRYETSAAKAKVAWNNVKDAAIEFGEVALPMLAQGAEMVAGFAKAVGALPGPVKSASAAMLGITAVLGGGLWFTAKTINGVATMRETLDNLGPTGAKAAGALGKVGKAAGAVTAIFAGFTIADSISKIGDEAVPGLEELTGTLIDLASAGASAKIASDFDSLGESIDRLTAKNAAQRLNDSLAGAIGVGKGRSLREAEAEIKALDQALSNLVSTGNADIAADALENLAAAQGLSASELKQLMSVLPGYKESLAGVANDAKLAASAEDKFAGAMEDSAAAADEEASALQDTIDAMREKRSEAIRGASAEINYQAAIDDARNSLKENGRTLDITTEKGRANKQALLDMAAAWNDQSDAAKNAPGAHRAAVASFVDLAKKMGMSEDKARALAKRIIEIPDKNVKVTADTSQARSALSFIERDLSKLDGRTARTYVTTVYDQQGHQTKGGLQKAAGGPVYGPGTSTSDSIPAYLSNGEYVIKAAAVAKYGTAMFDRLNAMRFADGGSVSRSTMPTEGGVWRVELHTPPADSRVLAREVARLLARGGVS